MTTQLDDYIQETLDNCSRYYDDSNFKEIAKETNKLLHRILLEIYEETKTELAGQDYQNFETNELNLLNGKQVSDIALKEFVILFEKLDILDLTTGNEDDRNLLRIYNLNKLVDINEQISYDDGFTEKYLLTLSDFVMLLISFKEWKQPPDIFSSITGNNDITNRIFELNRKTGVMTNPNDSARNVSFKTITFEVMLGQICKEVINKVLSEYSITYSDQNKNEIEEILNSILYQAGFDGGTSFGEALFRNSDHTKLHDKIKAWCEFDTDVGWGKFEDKLIVDETIKEVSGKIILKSNFLVTSVSEKDSTDFNLCSLMKGYIAGVLEKLLIGFSIKVTHDKNSGDCSRFVENKESCDFVVSST